MRGDGLWAQGMSLRATSRVPLPSLGPTADTDEPGLYFAGLTLCIIVFGRGGTRAILPFPGRTILVADMVKMLPPGLTDKSVPFTTISPGFGVSLGDVGMTGVGVVGGADAG